MGKGNKIILLIQLLPKKGDRIPIEPETALLVMQLMLMDNHELTLKNSDGEYHFTMRDPSDLYRRKGTYDVFDEDRYLLREIVLDSLRWRSEVDLRRSGFRYVRTCGTWTMN